MKDSFADLGLCPELLAELATLGYEEPTPIQKAAIEPLVRGQDLLGQAATGTGKTAAFALPMLERIGRERANPMQPLGLVLVPTRELAVQVAEAFGSYGKGLRVSVVPVFGGADFRRQAMGLRKGAQVVVATPGRALDHMRRGSLDLSALRMVVLDEADEMLDMGFAEDLEAILNGTPETRQTALFSATLPARIARIAEKHLRNPERVQIAREKGVKGTTAKVRQMAYVVPRAFKVVTLGRVLDMEDPRLALVFCRTRLEVDELADALTGRGYRVEALHGGMGQMDRDRVMRKARGEAVDVVVATDVAARGIDIDHLSHVVNFDVPSAPETYVHRIGRTGRAGREGTAITIATPREGRMMRAIETLTKQRFEMVDVPTPDQVRSRRLDRMRDELVQAVQAGSLEPFLSLVRSMTVDPAEVAAAALKAVHEARRGEHANEDHVQVPRFQDRQESPRDRPAAHAPAPQPARPERGPGWKRKQPERSGWTQRIETGPTDEAPARKPRREQGGGRGDRRAPEFVRLFVGGGKRMGMRPNDLVGAIANEADVNPRSLGGIEIGEMSSFVEVPAQEADYIIQVLRKATLRGRKVKVNRDLGFQRPPRAAR
ncbi:MAG: DEAD/DEAH box helicase [Planctomycetes bacterium]|nr:DEAD/DEAH box helicase [Planctomycetota bacterium]